MDPQQLTQEIYLTRDMDILIPQLQKLISGFQRCEVLPCSLAMIGTLIIQNNTTPKAGLHNIEDFPQIWYEL